jgi:hypothetical protein
MEKVEIDAVVYEVDSEVQEKVVNFYESLYQEHKAW